MITAENLHSHAYHIRLDAVPIMMVLQSQKINNNSHFTTDVALAYNRIVDDCEGWRQESNVYQDKKQREQDNNVRIENGGLLWASFCALPKEIIRGASSASFRGQHQWIGHKQLFTRMVYHPVEKYDSIRSFLLFRRAHVRNGSK